jgi:predicted phosphodiesterase
MPEHLLLRPAEGGDFRKAKWSAPAPATREYRRQRAYRFSYHSHTMGTQIFFAGDCHGGFEHVIEAVQVHRPAAIVLLGDQEAPARLDEILTPILGLTGIWWLPGNHDTDCEASYDHLFGSGLADRNLHGRVAEIAGVRIAGLGGVFRERVWAPPAPPLFKSAEDFVRRCGRGNRWRGGLPLKHRSTIFPDEYRRLARQRADVLVTHEAPGCHKNGFPALGELAQRLGVRTMLHGHHHEHYEARLDGAIKVIGVGLRGIVDLDGQIVVPGEPA